MDMEVIDTVTAYTLEAGDYISFDGAICAVKEWEEEEATGIITFVSEDDREREEFWFSKVDVYGYPSVEYI